MDDPISALDANVRKKVFMNVFMDHLSTKTRLLVTHAIDFAHLADKIIFMDKGRIVDQGSYQQLIQNEEFKNIVRINDINTKTGLNKNQDDIAEGELDQDDINHGI